MRINILNNIRRENEKRKRGNYIKKIVITIIMHEILYIWMSWEKNYECVRK